MIDFEEKTLSINSQKHLKIAIVGGSNSVMRSGYTKYLQKYIAGETGENVEFSNFSLGGVTSLCGVIQNYRYNIAKNYDIIFFEYCVNDRSAVIAGKYSVRKAGMALEGLIRQSKSMNPNCVIIILIFGTNLPIYYNNCCQISATYESIARRYDIPVINITEILLETKGIKFVKSLYKKDDSFHYARPKGTKIIGKLIAKQMMANNWLIPKFQQINKYYRMYAGHLQNLKFSSDFDSQLNQNNIKKSTFKNSLFEEEIYTIKADASLNFQFKGRLLGIMLKSDWYDGLFKIKLKEQELVTSSFSAWVEEEGMSNINLISLPYQKNISCNELTELSISVCQKNVENYELDVRKRKPKVSPEEWKTSIIGIAYIGAIN